MRFQRGLRLRPPRARAAGDRALRPKRELPLDREVVMLLRDEPELLAIADAVAATQRATLPGDCHHRPRPRSLRARVSRVWTRRRRSR